MISLTPTSPTRAATAVAGVYAVVGALWILFSDRALLAWYPDAERISQLQTFKGWAYVAVTAALVFLLVHRTVKALQTSQDARRQSEQRLMLALEGTQDGVWDWNLQTGALYLSERWFAMLDHDPQQLEPTHTALRDLVHPGDQARVNAGLDAHLAGQTSHFSCEYRLRTRTGEWRWVLDRAKIVECTEEGRPARVIGTHRDITERKQAEEELDRTQALFRAAIEQTPAGILIADAPDVKIRLANSAALGIRGEAAASLTEIPVELHPQNWQTFYPDGTPYKAEDLPLSKAILKGEISENVEVIIRRQSGENRWVLGNAAPVRDSEGTIVAGVVVFPDITERKQDEEQRHKLEAQLRQAQKMEAVGMLAGGIAHDFNNILTTILGNAELTSRALKADFPADSPTLLGLEQIELAAQRAARLTRQLLVFSRQDIARPGVLDLNRTITEMEKMLRRLIPEDVALELVTAPDLRRTHADAGQIEQVVMNLVVNARDAMPNGGKLSLETGNIMLDESYAAIHAEARVGEHVVFSVSDTGCGMDSATVERIFEPFFTTKPAGRGTGLGLATTYGIVRQSGGHITVYSEPERGTTFRVFLPSADSAVDLAQSRRLDGAAPAGSETILVCEDDQTVRHLAANLLKGAGYEVLAAENGRRAIELAAEHGGRIDLLLTDVIMPGMDGKSLSNTLSATVRGLKTLFMSGYTADVIADHGVLDEGVELLTKPFNRTGLLTCVREVLDRT